jgi:hypothetical protein
MTAQGAKQAGGPISRLFGSLSTFLNDERKGVAAMGEPDETANAPVETEIEPEGATSTEPDGEPDAEDDTPRDAAGNPTK